MTEHTAPPFALPPDSTITARLRKLAQGQRMVFFAGLPGVGKSLLIRELAHIAHAAGRRVHLLQWDVARYSVQTEGVAAKYPDVAGITHAVIRKAVGLWARSAVARWHAANPDDADLLIGETPLIGNRLVELAKPDDDAAEPLLLASTASFLVPVPSQAVREAVERARAATAARPTHERERGDASPPVMRAMWEELRQTASLMGIHPSEGGSYDADLYRNVYLRVLKHRRCEVLPLEIVLPPGDRSVYDLHVPFFDLAPTHAEGLAFVAQVERTYPVIALLEAEVARWYVV